MTRPAVALLATGLMACSLGASPARAATQTPPVEAPKPAPAPAPATPKPAPTQAPTTPAPQRPRTSTASSAATLTMSVKVTDSTGAPMVGTKVTASGPV